MNEPKVTINGRDYVWGHIEFNLHIDRLIRRTLNRIRDTNCELIYGLGELPIAINYPAYHKPILAQKTIDRAMTVTREIYLQFNRENR